MRTENLKPIYLLALNTGSVETDIAALRDFGVDYGDRAVLKGVYKGQEEPSYLVYQEEFTRDIYEFMKRHNQECVLYLDSQRFAKLIYQDSEVEIGRFKEVSKEFAEKQDGYTEHNNRYFIAS